MSDPPSLGKALVASLRSDEAIAVASQMAELAIDSQLTEGLLREVPVVGSVLAVARAGATVRDVLFVKKLFKFLSNFDGTSQPERDEMVRRLEGDSGYGRNVGEHLTYLLEKLDAHRKPAMVGRVFLSYMRGQIDEKTLNRLPDGHPKLLHLWPVKLLQAGQPDYDGSGLLTMRAAASLRR